MDSSLNISPFFMGEELKNKLTILPAYDESIRFSTQAERLLALNDIFDIYYPSFMATEIYSKLYLAYIRALKKKNSLVAVKQFNENRKALKNNAYQSVIGGSDSFSIIGVSGIGKSSAIARSISIISNDKFLFANNSKIIPFLTIQTPCDSSLKGLLLEVLRSIDFILDTKYYSDAIRTRATLDMLIGLVSQVCLNHVCVLIIDEAQNVVTSKNGKNLVNALVQLINNSGISLCFVGTPECNVFFESVFQLARRSVGLYYTSLQYDDYFRCLCQAAFSYQYTKKATKLTESIVSWLYSHSKGIPAVVISLIQSAQEIAILEGSEEICLETLKKAFEQRLRMLHGYIDKANEFNATKVKVKCEEMSIELRDPSLSKEESLKQLISRAKENGENIVEYLKSFIVIEEVAL